MNDADQSGQTFQNMARKHTGRTYEHTYSYILMCMHRLLLHILNYQMFRKVSNIQHCSNHKGPQR